MTSEKTTMFTFVVTQVTTVEACDESRKVGTKQDGTWMMKQCFYFREIREDFKKIRDSEARPLKNGSNWDPGKESKAISKCKHEPKNKK